MPTSQPVAYNGWPLKRAAQIENAIVSNKPMWSSPTPTRGSSAARLSTLTFYERRIQRAFQDDLALLEKLLRLRVFA